MKHLILEAAEVLDDLLTLSLGLWVIGSPDRFVDVVDGAGLRVIHIEGSVPISAREDM